MIQKLKKPISILLVFMMVVSLFTIVPISASAATWTFKLNSNFSGEWNADTDVVSEQPVELNLAEGDYEFQIVAYEDGNLSSYRGNEQAGSFTENYSQIMYDNGGNAKFHADGGKYTLTYNAGDGVVTIKPVYVAEINGTNYKTLEAAFAAAVDGDTIKLLDSSAGNGIIVPQGKFNTKGLTVDFDLNTYTVDGETVGSTGTETNGFQLLKDNKITFTNGTITSEKAKILVQNYSNLTLDNMTLTLDNPGYNSAYTLSNNNGNIVINETTINANPAGGFAFDVCRYASYPSVNVTVKGNSQINGNVEIFASGNDAKDGFSLNLESGTINDGDIVLDASAKTAMANTPEKAKVSKADTFTKTAPEGYKWVADGEGKQTLAPITYVAQIGNTKYETLADAFAAAQDGNTITVLADCAGNGIKVPQGKFNNAGLTVDFDGHTYNHTGVSVGSPRTETQAFQLLKDNNVTFKNGTLYSEKAKMLVQNYSNLTLDGMTLTLNNTGYNGAYTLSNNNGNVVINGTTINANPTTGSFAFDVCRFSNYPSVHVTVTGNSHIKGDVEISASGSDAKQGFSLTLESGDMTGKIVVDASAQALVGENNKVTKADTFTKEAPADFRWVDNGDGTSTLAPIPYVAKNTSTGAKYETLEDAVAAAQDGNTIKLLADCAGNGIKVPQGKFNNAGLTVDFDGHTYNHTGVSVGSPRTETQAFQLLKDNNVTFKNGTLYSEKAKMLVQNYSNLTLDGMTLTLNNTGYNGAYTLSNNNGNVVINGTTINANPTTGSFAFDVCRFSNYPSVHVTVTGNSHIKGDVEISASGSDAKQGFSLTLESGTMSGEIILDQTAKNVLNATPKKLSVTKASDFNQKAPEGYMWVDTETAGVQTIAKAVAQIGETKYATLEAAFAAAQDGETIKLLADCAGNGIKAPQGKFATGLTVDFDGHTYTVDGETVGSTGTETNGFQLLKDNNITFKNGTITSAKAKILVQNYSNLTLDGMTLTLNNPNYTGAYTLSNNNGDIFINNTTINANPAGGFAFDVCRYASYPSVKVTVEGNSQINGNVEVYASNNDPKNGFSLNLESGTMTGDIVVTPSAAAAMAATPEKASVNKQNTFAQDPAEGYKWKDNGNGTSTLVKVQKLFVAHSITLSGDIGVNFFLDPSIKDEIDNAQEAYVDFVWDDGYTYDVDHNSDERARVDLQGAPLTTDGIQATCYVPVAYMASNIHAVVVIDGVAKDETDDYTVQEYAETIIANEDNLYSDELVTLAKEMLNYGAMAQKVFGNQLMANTPMANANIVARGYTMANVTTDDIINAIKLANNGKVGATAEQMNTAAAEAGLKYYTTSLVFLSKSTLRHWFSRYDWNTPSYVDDNLFDGSQSDFYYYKEVKNIPAAELDTLQTFTIGSATFKYSALDYAKDVIRNNTSEDAKNLAKALYLYNRAANAYFES